MKCQADSTGWRLAACRRRSAASARRSRQLLAGVGRLLPSYTAAVHWGLDPQLDETMELNSLDLPKRPEDTRVVVAMSGGVDSSVVAGLLARAGLRRRGRHAAALRSWRGDAPQGRLLRRAGHSRCAPGRGGARHSALRARLRGALRDRGDRAVRQCLSAGRDAGAVHRLQPVGEVRRPDGGGAGSRRRCAGDRALRADAARGRQAAAVPAGRCVARPELFPVRDDRGSSSTSCASRSAA